MLCYILRLSLKQSYAAVFGAQVTTAHLYHGQDTFDFDQGNVINNQSINHSACFVERKSMYITMWNNPLEFVLRIIQQYSPHLQQIIAK